MSEPSDLEQSLLPSLSVDTQSLLARVVSYGLPEGALGAFARWWQLESWLRELAYTELRARDGVTWADNAKMANGRLASDTEFTHMAGPDRSNPLAYLDYTQLLKLIDANWNLFDRTLLVRSSWEGRQYDLQRIRHRIAHLRWPAGDDQERVEQTLRNLEHGAFIALATYNRRFVPSDLERNHPVADGWVNKTHEDAKRLIDHAANVYDVRFSLTRSFRPWAESGLETLPGKLWHADLRTGIGSVDIGGIWRDIHNTEAGRLLIAIESDYDNHVGFTFAAVDDGEKVADAIGEVFEVFLAAGRSSAADPSLRKDATRRWARFDHRIRIDTAWNIVEKDTVPISVFGTGGGTEYAPTL